MTDRPVTWPGFRRGRGIASKPLLTPPPLCTLQKKAPIFKIFSIIRLFFCGVPAAGDNRHVCSENQVALAAIKLSDVHDTIILSPNFLTRLSSSSPPPPYAHCCRCLSCSSQRSAVSQTHETHHGFFLYLFIYASFVFVRSVTAANAAHANC